MSWNYRVIEKDGGFGVHGAYYDEHENITGIDQDPNVPIGETVDQLRTTLELMLEALKKPILDYKEFDT